MSRSRGSSDAICHSIRRHRCNARFDSKKDTRGGITNRNRVMDENMDTGQRGLQMAQDQFSEYLTQAEEYVREKPAQSVLMAVLAGFVLNRLPIFRLLGGVVRLALFALKPALLVYGATKVYEAVQQE